VTGDFNRDSKLDWASINPGFREVAVSLNSTTVKDSIAQGVQNGVGYIDASSEESGKVTIDLTKGTFVLEGTTRITRSIRNVDEAIGTIFDDSMTGNKRNNLLNGFAGRDELLGEDGDDRLVGGASNDQLEGGDGKDRFIFTTTPNYPEGLNQPFRKALLGVDRILDFERGKDQIVLDQGSFTEVDKKVKFDSVDSIKEARTSSGIITYIRDSGKLFYNPNGSRSGFGEGGLFAVLEGDVNLGRKDFSVFL
jgi:Ca2+-binding RTX toxin-like protein